MKLNPTNSRVKSAFLYIESYHWENIIFMIMFIYLIKTIIGKHFRQCKTNAVFNVDNQVTHARN